MMARRENAAERVRRRIIEWLDREGHGSRKRLADAVPREYGESRSASWVTDLTRGPAHSGQDLRLKDLDAVADAMGVPPGDLVRWDDNLYAEVTPTELRLLRFLRALPDLTRHYLIGYYEYLFSLQQTTLEAQARERDRRTEIARQVRGDDRRRTGKDR